MKNEQQKPIDEVFRQALEEPGSLPAFEEQNWDALEKMLDGKKKPYRIAYWRPILTAAAAIILLALGWWYLLPKTQQNTNNAQQILVKQPKGMDTPHKGNTTVAVSENTTTVKERSQPVVIDEPRLSAVETQLAKKNEMQNTVSIPADKHLPQPTRLEVILLPKAPCRDDMLQLASVNAHADSLPAVDVLSHIPIALLDFRDEQLAANGKGLKPQLAINVLGAADMNGVSSFNSVGTGKNIGLLFSAKFNKLTISTGAYYSYKPYAMEFSQYSPNSTYKFKYNPENVIADCRMLDIPVNIDYQLFSKNKNTISIGTGISSYIMLRESYAYTYAGPYTGVSSYDVKSPGKYLFGAVNFQATYRRQINSKLGINVMPYIKIPLAEVGYSRVRLQTAGVAIGFNWNLNSLGKPK
ncbi:porin family protein [Mucilaginibacter auburnensis]|uniref:Outer membrane protein with beta-barrel domain n=1 Tax=Mucilaginibacter auburnensis TaxID=1457233 RepID=A0A2H9VQT6_9SPHI|nr:hypothetical protein [Mucilaginibacter auburnensis]PJJ83128.1 hypothetical protein CLV57_0106 [Mucilaginibacter auburnensis]